MVAVTRGQETRSREKFDERPQVIRGCPRDQRKKLRRNLVAVR